MALQGEKCFLVQAAFYRSVSPVKAVLLQLFHDELSLRGDATVSVRKCVLSCESSEPMELQIKEYYPGDAQSRSREKLNAARSGKS